MRLFFAIELSDALLKFGGLLSQFDDDAFKIILEFVAQAAFEFFAIHVSFSSIESALGVLLAGEQ